MNVRKSGQVIALALSMSLSLGGCFLLPKEAQMPSLPLVTAGEVEDYRTASVQRGDLSLTATVSFSGVSLQEENLSFTLSGERYGGIYVQVGDSVSAGDLVAEMSNSTENTQLAAIDERLSQLEIELDTARQSLEVASRLGGRDADTYQAQVTELEDEVYVLGLRRQELEEQKDGRRLYAGIDGVVTYIKSISQSSTTMKNSTVVTISNREQSVFAAFTEHYESFPTGQELELTVGDTPYRALVTSPEDLGFEPESREEKGVYKQRVYLVLQDSDVFFESSSIRGEVHLLLDSREDALYLPSSAIVTIGGQDMVYYQDESGLRSAKPVQTGLEADQGVEIISGLAEGDEVIISR